LKRAEGIATILST